MKQSAIDALAMTGIELEELQDVGAALLREAPKDSRVCICGHSMNKHTAINGYVLCKPSRMTCPCKAIRPVLTSTNVRPFMRKSSGSGSAHALMQGFRKAIELDADISWIEPPTCDYQKNGTKCGSTDQVVPCLVTQNGFYTTEATGYDVFLCISCKESL
jgi:hypothetical protein